LFVLSRKVVAAARCTLPPHQLLLASTQMGSHDVQQSNARHEAAAVRCWIQDAE